MIVMHATVGGFKSSLNWLCSPHSKVSTGYLIDKDGSIYQLVPDDRAAWHAGKSVWQGETAINELSIGIELVNSNSGKDPYPFAQLEAAIALVNEQIERFHIDPSNVVRHLDIAIPRGRKTDPAGFPWDMFKARISLTSGHYRVRPNTSAYVRTGPYQNKPILKTLRTGDAWEGREVRGQRITLGTYGSNDIWIANRDGHCVWSGLLVAG